VSGVMKNWNLKEGRRDGCQVLIYIDVRGLK
jgi:hypothetical protein